MGTLIMRNLDDAIVQKLKQHAAKHARSAEAEHPAILEAALGGTRRKNLASLLASMPNVGLDTDFARKRDREAPTDVSD